MCIFVTHCMFGNEIESSSTDQTLRYERALSADMTILIREDIYRKISMTEFRGMESYSTSLIMLQNFAFHKYSIAHAFGHTVGCAHLPDPEGKILHSLG